MATQPGNFHYNQRQQSTPVNHHNNMYNNNMSPHHTPQNTDPDQIQQLPSLQLLQLSQPIGPKHQPEVFNYNNNNNNNNTNKKKTNHKNNPKNHKKKTNRKNKHKHKRKRHKKSLPNKPLPDLPPSTHQRQRSKSDQILQAHALNAIKYENNIHQHHHVQQIAFQPHVYNNNGYTNNYNLYHNNNHYHNNHHGNQMQTRGKSNTVHLINNYSGKARTSDIRHDKRNFANIRMPHNKQKRVRSNTPSPAAVSPPKRPYNGAITPSHSLSGSEISDRDVIINRLNKHKQMPYPDEDGDSNNSTDSDSCSYSYSQSNKSNTSNSVPYKAKPPTKKKGFFPPKLNTGTPPVPSGTATPPPATHRKKPESPRYRTEHFHRRNKQQRMKPVKPQRPPPPSSVPVSASVSKPLLVLSQTSSTYGTDNTFNHEIKLKHKNAASDTLSVIKHKQKRAARKSPDLERLMSGKQDPHKAFVDLTNRTSGSLTDLTKRIREQHSDRPHQLPASFAKYKHVKKTSTSPSSKSPVTFNASIAAISPLSIINTIQKQQSAQSQSSSKERKPFVPPPPNSTTQSLRAAIPTEQSFDDEDEDEDGIVSTDYLNQTTQVVLTNTDSDPIATGKAKKHYRGRSLSVDSPLRAVHAYTASNFHASDDSDHYSFSEEDENKRVMIKNLKITMSNHSNQPIGIQQTPSPVAHAAPFELVHESDEEDEDDIEEEKDVKIKIVVHTEPERSTSSENPKKKKKKKKKRKKSSTKTSKSSKSHRHRQKHLNLDANRSKSRNPVPEDMDGNGAKVTVPRRASASAIIVDVGDGDKKKKKKKWYHMFAKKSDKSELSELYTDDDDISDTSSTQSRPQSVRSALTPRGWSKKSKKTNLFDLEFPSTAYSSYSSMPGSPGLSAQDNDDKKSVSNGSLPDDHSIRTAIFDDFAVDIPLSNIEVAQKILNMKYSDWNFDHDMVHVYRAQCATLQYAKFIPKLTQLIYPSILSSLSLPVQILSCKYRVYCKYNIKNLKFAAGLRLNEEQEEKADKFSSTPPYAWDNQASISTFDLTQFKSGSPTQDKLHNSILFHHSNCMTDNHNIHVSSNQDIDMVEIEFTHETRTQDAIKQIFTKICNSNNVAYETKVQFQLLDLECFVLKTCGREEYLRFNDNIPIVASNYIRNCLRNDNISTSLEFVLLYVYDLNTYNEKNYRLSLSEWYRQNTYHDDIFEYFAKKPLVSDMKMNHKKSKKKTKLQTENSSGNLGVIEEDKEEEIIAAKKKAKTKEKQLKYEALGYNCIVDTLIASHEKNKLTQLNLSVEKEVDWLYSTVGSVLESNDDSGQQHQRNKSSHDRNKHRSVSSLHRSMNFTQHQQEQIEIDWGNIPQSAVLLDEFEHPIEIKIKSLKHVTNAPRFKLHSYAFVILRIELMFGSNVFEECSWDIRIPHSCITNSIKMAANMSTFSTQISELFYSMIPREAIWCFTIYGIRKMNDSASENKKTNKNPVLKHLNDSVKPNVLINESMAKANLVNNGSDLVSVSSEFLLFNRNKSKSAKSPKRSYRSSAKSPPHSPLSPRSPHTPSSPYTPRGKQLKTKRKLGVNTRYIHGSNSSDSSSSRSTVTVSSTGSAVAVAVANAITVSVAQNGSVYNDNFSDLYSGDGSDLQSIFGEDASPTDDAPKWRSEPLAWCRLPVVDHRHCVRKGNFQLHLWSVPIYKYKKGGPKVDPYTTGFWKKFGTTRDRGLKKYVKHKLKGSRKKKADWKFGLEAEDNEDIILNIEFPHFVFDVVAPLVNPRRPEYIARSIKAYKRREFPGKQVLLQIVEQDGITPLDDKDKMLIYSNKEKLMRYPSAIPTFLRSVDWLDCELRMEAYDYLERWKKPSDNPEDMIELLRYEFCDTRIRLYAINCLNQLDDYTLNRYLLQLVQALKNELHHNSFLSRFLMFRALRNPLQIGHYLFWALKSEYDYSKGWCERFGVLLEEYLLHLPNNLENIGIHYSKEILYQNNFLKRLTFLSQRIQMGKKQKIGSNKLHMFLLHELSILNQELGHKNKSLTLPLNPCLRIIKLNVSKCKFMSSAKAPLWLVFTNADSYSYLYPTNIGISRNFQQIEQDTLDKINEYKKKKKKKKGKKHGNNYNYLTDEQNNNIAIKHDIQVMYKYGDDLRQDILTLQLIAVMDAFWLCKNSDLRMKPYQVIQTGNQSGMVELVLNAKTTNEIHTKHGTIRGAFNHKAHLLYLKSNINARNKKNQNGYDILKLQENYARSCAGYSVATWVLGIGDRHPDNIMIDENGVIFHIDFGHFLGNFKHKQVGGGLIKWNRERSPFVFTSLMKYAIDCGVQDAQLYREFVQWIFKAYSEIRVRFKFFLNLFLLMVPSQMPQLVREYDVAYLRNALRLDLDSFQDIAIHVEKTVKQCLNDKYRLVDNTIHARKHAN